MNMDKDKIKLTKGYKFKSFRFTSLRKAGSKNKEYSELIFIFLYKKRVVELEYSQITNIEYLFKNEKFLKSIKLVKEEFDDKNFKEMQEINQKMSTETKLLMELL